jgi:hypothetical protein
MSIAAEAMMKEVSRKNAYLLLLKRKLFVLSTKPINPIGGELELLNDEIESHETIDKVNSTISRINKLKRDIKTETQCEVALNRMKSQK